MKQWIWSDLHLNHENIITYETRPFRSVTEMNRKIIHNWTSTVGKHDVLFNLGDFVFNNGNKEVVQGFLRTVPGYKILIMGNHDRSKTVRWWIEAGFNEVYKYPIIIDTNWILSHEPVLLSETTPYMNIHGHSHKKNPGDSQRANVSVELLDYKPKLLDEVKNEILRRKEEKE